MKKFISSILACLMIMGCTTTAFASSDLPAKEDENESAIVVDMDDIDVTQPYEVTKEYVNDQGQTITLKAVYTPAEPTISPLWSKEHNATVGTWRSYYDGWVAGSMSYEFDVSKSGSHWKISNARNFTVRCLFSTIRDKSLTINRSTSTSTYPAEVMGSCVIDVVDTPIGHIMSLDAWIKTTVSDSGILTVSGN